MIMLLCKHIRHTCRKGQLVGKGCFIVPLNCCAQRRGANPSTSCNFFLAVTILRSDFRMNFIMETLRTVISTASYPAFMVTNFSSKIMLTFFALHCVFESSAFGLFDAHLAHTNLIGMISFRVLRCSVTVCLGLVWLLKTADGAEPPSKGLRGAFVPYLLKIQGSAVLLMTLALSIQALYDVYMLNPLRVGLSPHALLSLSGLKQVAPLAFFVMRDTPSKAIVTSWLVCVLVSAICCVQAQDKEQLVTLLLYAMASFVIFSDCVEQNRKMVDIVSKLQNTLEENEKLAVEAQAVELRAMIGNVAHDLKTPLTSFLSGIECISDIVDEWYEYLLTPEFEDGTFVWTREHTIKGRQSNALMKSCVANMNSTNSFMTMTINRCLDYTKTTNGFKLVPKFETVCLQSALDMPVTLMRDANLDVQIRMTPLSDEISSHIITDKQWLLENLLCLLSNAAKYSHRGFIDISVTLSGSLAPALHFEIQDTGIGLSDEAMQGLFNPFKQAQRLAGGTGLGLFSLAKRVEALQGQYGVKQRPDGEQGCLFWFTIPYRPDEMSANLLKPRPIVTLSLASVDEEVSTSTKATPGPVYEVLVVDDAPLIVKMTTMLLQRKGHRVQHAVNGVEALEKLMVRAGSGDSSTSPRGYSDAQTFEPQFDAVLMDLQMPVLDGLEAIRRLRAAEKKREGAEGASRRQFVVALSANSDEETRQEALAAGADAFIPKPFAYDAFLDVMKD